jgi:hypothetical protein
MPGLAVLDLLRLMLPLLLLRMLEQRSCIGALRMAEGIYICRHALL